MTREELAGTLAVLVAVLRPGSGGRWDQVMDELRRCASEGGELPPAASRLVALGQETPHLELEKDYVRLFLSPRGALCPPWAGAWLGTPPRLFGPQHEAVLELARQLGVEPANFDRESADHVATELALAGYCLTHNEVEVFREFWRRQLEPWLGAFGECLSKHAQTEFFQGVGMLLRELAANGSLLLAEGADESGSSSPPVS